MLQLIQEPLDKYVPSGHDKQVLSVSQVLQSELQPKTHVVSLV